MIGWGKKFDSVSLFDKKQGHLSPSFGARSVIYVSGGETSAVQRVDLDVQSIAYINGCALTPTLESSANPLGTRGGP